MQTRHDGQVCEPIRDENRDRRVFRLYQGTASGGDRLANIQVVSDDIGRGGGEKDIDLKIFDDYVKQHGENSH